MRLSFSLRSLSNHHSTGIRKGFTSAISPVLTHKRHTIAPPSRRHYSMSSSLSSSPPWLTTILNDDSSSPPPRIYRWTPSPPQQEQHPQLQESNVSSDPSIAEDPRRIYILGAGNIGRLYAAHLAKHSPSPPLTLVVHRRSLLEHWAANPGVEIFRPGSDVPEKTHEGINVEYWIDNPDAEAGIGGSVQEIGHIHNIIIATKSEAAIPEADRLRRYLNHESTVAFAQNGMSKMWPPHGSAYVAHRYPEGSGITAPNFAACITTHGVISLGPFRSRHASPADAKVGLVLPGSGDARSKADYLMETCATAPGLDSQLVSKGDLWVSQLLKLVVNSTINPITAVLRCKNGVLFSEPTGPLVDVMDRLLKETSVVYQALVRHPSTAEIFKEESDVVEKSSGGPLEPPQERLFKAFAVPPMREMLWSVGYKVTENTSSMLQDVQAGKKTEVRDFNGWIVDMARFLDQGLDVSGHQTLMELVESGEHLSQEELYRAML